MTIHHVFANKSNIGDWLSARGIQQLLSPLQVVEHLCDEPFVPKSLEELAKAGADDLIVIGGGGLFMDYFVPFWEGFLDIAARVPFCIWGVGYCDMKRENSQPPKQLIQDTVEASAICIVRDELTWRHLQECQLPSPIGCPSMNVIDSRPLGFGLLHVDAYDNVGHDNYEIMDALGREFAARTGRPLGRINNTIPGGDMHALQNTLDKYTQSDLILTGRLHGCIIGLAMGRKILAVSGDRKVESFMSAAGLSDWVLDKDNLSQLPDSLMALPHQDTPTEFVETSRLSNGSVAKKISELLNAGRGGA